MKIKLNSDIEEFIKTVTNNIIGNCDRHSCFEMLIAKQINNKEEKKVLKMYKNIGIERNTIKYDANEILNNPYYKSIKFDNIKYKNIKYCNKILKANECINMSYTKRKNDLLQTYYDIGYLNKNVNIPMLKENDQIWMSPTIAEQRSMEKDIKKATGNVLTFGLGIGYYTYMCLLKEEVKSITIVELNKDVIELFEKYILPQFNIDKKINIIHGNIYDYYNVNFLSQFDYIFVDIWQSNTDGLEHYKNLMKTGIRKNNIGYWIEDSIIESTQYLMFVYFRSIAKRILTDAMQKLDKDNFLDLKRIHKYFRNINETVIDVNKLVFYINDINTIRDILAIEV